MWGLLLKSEKVSQGIEPQCLVDLFCLCFNIILSTFNILLYFPHKGVRNGIKEESGKLRSDENVCR